MLLTVITMVTKHFFLQEKINLSFNVHEAISNIFIYVHLISLKLSICNFFFFFCTGY